MDLYVDPSEKPSHESAKSFLSYLNNYYKLRRSQYPFVYCDILVLHNSWGNKNTEE